MHGHHGKLSYRPGHVDIYKREQDRLNIQIEKGKDRMGKLAIQIHKLLQVKSFPYDYTSLMTEEFASDTFPALTEAQKVYSFIKPNLKNVKLEQFNNHNENDFL